MAGITLEQAEARLAGSLELAEKLENGQEVRRGDRVLKYSDLKDVRETIDYWEAKVNTLSKGDGSGDIIPRSIIPID